jgi:hypothetical protein
MATPSSYALPGIQREAAGWLRSPSWDLTFISLSAVLVALPYSVYRILTGLGVAESASASAVDLVVTLFIGGPHMYATFTRTVADRGFRLHHRRIIATSALIPVGVVLLGYWALPILLTLFFFWASIHVLHQITFLVECYNRRSPRAPSLSDRLIDYAVVITSPYPIAFDKLVRGEFKISDVPLAVPPLLQQDVFVYLAYASFFGSLALFLAKTAREIYAGRAHYPKLLLIGLTVTIAFFLPTFDRLDAAFQGFNAWHSFQYLGLTWYANKLAAERGHTVEGGSTLFPTDGPRFYGGMVLCTIGAGIIYGALVLLRGPLGLSQEQPYYITVLSFLLIHYYHDHVLFTRPEAIVAEAR